MFWLTVGTQILIQHTETQILNKLHEYLHKILFYSETDSICGQSYKLFCYIQHIENKQLIFNALFWQDNYNALCPPQMISLELATPKATISSKAGTPTEFKTWNCSCL